MHEIGIVRELIGAVEKQAVARGASRVTRVKLRFNPLVSYDADHVQFTFDLVKKESALVSDATLALDIAEGKVRCEHCGHEFVTDRLPNICPRCDSLKLVPVETAGVELVSFEIER